MTKHRILIASYLEPEYVERIRAVDTQVEVLYEPELLPIPTYPGDHYLSTKRSPQDEAYWRTLMACADIFFDFDFSNLDELPELAPKLRWLQASSAGIGQHIHRRNYAQRMPNTIFTTASGIHIQPLAEFCAMAILMFSRNYYHMLAMQQEKRWQRFAATDLLGRTLGILGVGKIGAEVARFSKTFGMRTIGIKRHIEGVDPASLDLDALYPPDQLHTLLRQSEFLVIVTPHTHETERMLGAAELAMLPHEAVLINIGRGAVIDEAALIAALRSGHLGGAALDVFEKEPLPAENPLWSMPNVLISPHSASTSDRENARLTDLICDNLRRYLDGRPLRNVLDMKLLY